MQPYGTHFSRIATSLDLNSIEAAAVCTNDRERCPQRVRRYQPQLHLQPRCRMLCASPQLMSRVCGWKSTDRRLLLLPCDRFGQALESQVVAGGPDSSRADTFSVALRCLSPSSLLVARHVSVAAKFTIRGAHHSYRAGNWEPGPSELPTEPPPTFSGHGRAHSLTRRPPTRRRGRGRRRAQCQEARERRDMRQGTELAITAIQLGRRSFTCRFRIR